MRRYRYETLRLIGWPLFRVARFTSWCGHRQELIPVPDEGEWVRLVPIIGEAKVSGTAAIGAPAARLEGRKCDRELPVRRYKFEHLDWIGWPTKPMHIFKWCGHSQQFVAWTNKGRSSGPAPAAATSQLYRVREGGRLRWEGLSRFRIP